MVFAKSPHTVKPLEQKETIVATRKIDPEKAEEIAESLGVEFDGEQFRIGAHFANAKKVTHVVLGRDLVEGIPIEEYIRAVQKFYPTFESGKEFDAAAAVKALRAEESKNKKAA